jgi:hypothetical protein
MAIVALAFINSNRSTSDNIFCTGALITKYHILTSEHCFDYSLNFPYVIVAGSNDVNFGTTYYPSWWLSYDQWCNSRRIRITEPNNDIALIKVNNC